MMKIRAHVGYLVVFIGFMGIILVFTFSASESKVVKDKKDKPIPATMLITGVSIPEKLDFAGETVPLDYFDVKESLEKELLINSYWHSQTLMLLKRSSRYFAQIEPVLKANNIPDDFKFLALAESGFANVTSPAGAVGFWQFLPNTAREYGLQVDKETMDKERTGHYEIDERYNVEKSTKAACMFLQQSYDLYKSWTMAAASFNMGRLALNKQVQRQYSKSYYDIFLNEETARYVYRILALKLIISDPQHFGFNIPKEELYQPIPSTEVTVSKPIKDLALFAFEKGTNYKILKILNPWLRDNTLTNRESKTYVIKIPAAGYRKIEKEIKKEEIDKIISQGDQLPQ